MKVSYLTVEGVIEQTYKTTEDKWDKPRLDFGSLRIDKDHIFQGWVDLPATDLELGQLFAVITRYVPARDQRIAQDIEDKRNKFLDFDWIHNEECLVQHLNDGIEAFPDDAELIQGKAVAAATRIQERRKEEYTKQLAYDLKESERQQLHAMARYAWSQTFEVFKVEYGAHVVNDDEDAETITRTFYSNSEMPLEDGRGYWHAYKNGQLSRMIKPANIMSVERIKINNRDSAPHDVRRQVQLQSKALTDVQTYVDLPPLEYFAFDYDAIKIAVEAEQPNDQAEE